MARHLLYAACFSIFWLSSISATAAPPPGPRDKCPVCGMFVKKYPTWIASVSYSDGSHAWFDGAKDLFIYLHNLPKYAPGRKAAAMQAVQVKDYYSLEEIDAKQAVYVIGSTVYGPMGHELIPFAKQADAEEFMKDHQGKRVIRYSDVTPALLKTLE